MGDNLFLIGFMGAGKTSFGKRLARKLKWKFLDADREIEKMENRSIPEIFEEKGEEGFRKLETDWLKDLECQQTIISLGGGTPCFNNNMELIGTKGQSIYLELSPKLLVDRLTHSKTERPLIAGIKNDSKALLVFVEELLAKRENYYQQADLKVSGMSFSANRVEDLLRELKKLREA